MRVPVLTAVSDAVWEAQLVAGLERGDEGVAVVRRCVDLGDLLATAATGQARAVLLSADFRRLDREALTRLAVSRVAVVGLVARGDERSEQRLRQLGVQQVLPTDSSTGEVAEAVHAAVAGLGELGVGEAVSLAEPRAALAPDPAMPPEDGPGLPEGTGGRVVAVWGPTGAPGRTTVAVGVASEVAALGRSALLVDADVHGGVVAQVLGVLDESPGLAAACRLATSGTLDAAALRGLARTVAPGLALLSGIARAERWPELRPSAVEDVLVLARGFSEVTVVDCGFGLEQDEELSYDTAAPRRHGATLTALGCADVVVAVGSADPVGLQRLVRGLSDLREAVPGVAPVVVLNRLRGSVVPGEAAEEVAAALARYAGVEPSHLVPLDVAGVDAAVAAGRTLAEASPASPARAVLRALAADLVGAERPVRRGWRRRG